MSGDVYCTSDTKEVNQAYSHIAFVTAAYSISGEKVVDVDGINLTIFLLSYILLILCSRCLVPANNDVNVKWTSHEKHFIFISFSLTLNFSYMYVLYRYISTHTLTIMCSSARVACVEIAFSYTI